MIVIYDTTTGQIKRVSTASGQALSGEGEFSADVPYNVSETHYADIANTGELIALPAQPSDFHTWDWASKTWQEDVQSARDYVSSQWATWIVAQFQLSVTHDSMPFPTDDGFYTDLIGLVVLADLSLKLPPYVVRRFDSGTHSYATSLGIKDLAAAVNTYRDDAKAQMKTAVDQLPGATTVAAVLNLLPP